VNRGVFEKGYKSPHFDHLLSSDKVLGSRFDHIKDISNRCHTRG